MFNSLRSQFIATIMLIISVILIMSFAAIYVSAASSLGRRLDTPSGTTLGSDVGDGIMSFFQKQREDYAERAMSDLLLTLIISGLATLTAVYFVSRHIADRAIGPIEEAYEKQRQFVADASHELKTPITIIGANVDAAIGDSKKPSKWLENIRNEVDHSARLVNDLLVLARFDVDQMPSNKKRFDIAEVCRDLAGQFGILASEKDIKLTKRLNGPLYAFSDEEKVRQIMTILLDNAIKHTQKGGQVLVAGSRKKDHITLRVENSHEDIPAEKLDQLFERFYQADDSHSNRGTGLGLSIAQKIARHMKWSLEARSADGTVSFSLTVPR